MCEKTQNYIANFDRIDTPKNTTGICGRNISQQSMINSYKQETIVVNKL